MSDWGVELASMFKARDHKDSIGAIIGRVVQVSPMKIEILNGKMYLDSDFAYITETVKKGDISVNDNVLVIASSDNQDFFVVDKI